MTSVLVTVLCNQPSFGSQWRPVTLLVRYKMFLGIVCYVRTELFFILNLKLYFSLFIVCSLTPRSNPVEMPKSQDGTTVVASTCSSMPYATFIEAAESGWINYQCLCCLVCLMVLWCIMPAAISVDMFPFRSTLTWAVSTGPTDWVCHIVTFMLCIGPVA